MSRERFGGADIESGYSHSDDGAPDWDEPRCDDCRETMAMGDMVIDRETGAEVCRACWNDRQAGIPEFVAPEVVEAVRANNREER